MNGNFYDAIMSNPNEVWQKIDSIYKPNPLIVGTKVDVDPVKFNDNTHMPFDIENWIQRKSEKYSPTLVKMKTQMLSK